MVYSKSYLFLGLNLFLFLSSQVLADIHGPQALIVEPNLPPMANKLDDKEISELRAYFTFFDKDGDGSINNKELETLIQSDGLNSIDFDLMVSMNKFDADENGTIHFLEYLNLMAQKMTDKELKITFDMCDKDHNGFVSASELRYFMTNLDQKLIDEEVDEFVHEADVDGDGHINFEEFVKVTMLEWRDKTKI